MITTNSISGTEPQLNMIGRDQRAWEGQVAGQHWIARVVYVDERAKICALHVSTGSDRDDMQGGPNCHWDYQYEHLVRRYHEQKVPHEVATDMRDSVRAWVGRYLRDQHQKNSALTVRPGPSRHVPVTCSWLPAKEVMNNRVPSHLS